MIFIGAGPDEHLVGKPQQPPLGILSWPAHRPREGKMFYDFETTPNARGGWPRGARRVCTGSANCCSGHSLPWSGMDYIENGRNGVIVKPPHDVTNYAATVADLLLDEPTRAKLVAECEHASLLYTIEGMVERLL